MVLTHSRAYIQYGGIVLPGYILRRLCRCPYGPAIELISAGFVSPLIAQKFRDELDNVVYLLTCTRTLVATFELKHNEQYWFYRRGQVFVSDSPN